MKIVDVKTHVLGTAWRNLTFVRVLTDEGLEGLGEVRMLNHTDALLGYFAEAMPNHILGHDPFNIEDLVERMYRNDYARAGEIAMSAIATVEIACWDIIGKALGQPVYKLLGGAVRNRIKAYANGWYTVERTPQEFHAAAKRVLEKGYRALKFDPFGAGFYELERAEKNRVIEDTSPYDSLRRWAVLMTEKSTFLKNAMASRATRAKTLASFFRQLQYPRA